MSNIRILTSNALGAFADMVYYNRDRAYRLWLISPWLAVGKGRTDPISLLVESARGHNISARVVTRPPAMEWHSKTLRILLANMRVELFYCANLHAKLYILECDGFRYAQIGSANLTGRSLDNYELGVEFSTTRETRGDDTSSLIADLLDYANYLLREDDVLMQDDI